MDIDGNVVMSKKSIADLIIQQDKLTQKINRWYEKQQRRRERAARFHRFFDSIWNKFFWFLK